MCKVANKNKGVRS